MSKCEHCNKEGQAMISINNYVVKYHTWEAYNCCSKDCARQKAKSELGLDDDDIDAIEG